MSYALNRKIQSLLGESSPNWAAVIETPSWLWAIHRGTGVLVKCLARDGLGFTDAVSHTCSSTTSRTGDCVCADGDVIFIGTNEGMLYAVVRTGDSIASYSLNLGLGQIYGVYSDTSGIIHCICNDGSNLKAVEFDGSMLYLRATKSLGTDAARCIAGDGTNIVLGRIQGSDGLFSSIRYSSGAYGSFLGNTTISGGTVVPGAIIHDGTTWYFGDRGTPTTRRIYAYTLSSDGTTFTEVTTGFDLTPFGSVNCIKLCTDGYFVFALLDGTTDYLLVLRLSGTTWSVVSSYALTIYGTMKYDNMNLRAPYLNLTNSPYIECYRLDLTATFTVNRTTGVAPVTITFTRT